jgi:hypothetical protein
MEVGGLKCLLPRSKDNVRITSDMHDNDGLTQHAIQEAEWSIAEDIGRNDDMKNDDGQLIAANANIGRRFYVRKCRPCQYLSHLKHQAGLWRGTISQYSSSHDICNRNSETCYFLLRHKNQQAREHQEKFLPETQHLLEECN